MDRKSGVGLLQSVAREYKANAADVLAHLKSAFSAQDFKAIRAWAHHLQSGSALLGLELAAALCRQIEEEALAGRVSPTLLTALEDSVRSGSEQLLSFVSKMGVAR